jgi:hypothetical protein
MEMNSMEQVMTVDCKNWSEGAPDASLFEVSVGYSKMPGMLKAGENPKHAIRNPKPAARLTAN